MMEIAAALWVLSRIIRFYEDHTYLFRAEKDSRRTH